MNPIGRALNFNEVLQYKKVLQNHLIGAQLQDVVMVESGVLFKFYLKGHFTLIVDSTQARPLILIFEDEIKLKSIGPKPLSLFLKSHVVGKRLTQIRVKESYGRVLEFEFANGVGIVEVRLIPKSFNILVFAEDKKISLLKPLDLKEQIEKFEEPLQLSEESHFFEISKEWLAQKNKSSSNKSKDSSSGSGFDVAKAIQKKQNALAALEAQLLLDESVEYYQLGERLKSLLPNEYALVLTQHKILDPKLSQSENIQRCFEKAKQIIRKKEGTQERLQILQKEIADLQSGKLPQQAQNQQRHFLSKVDVKTRKLTLGDIEAYMGKSAQDNLLLLRKSQSWDIWMHLRDFPSTHVIIRRNKNRVVTQAEIKKVAQWLVKESKGLGKNAIGQSYMVIYTECRYVKPIKGSVGLVQYHNQSELLVHIEN